MTSPRASSGVPIGLIVFVLVAGSLVLGLIAAASAYLAPLSLPDRTLAGLTAADTMASAPGGTAPDAPPLLRKGETLDATTLERLRSAGAQRVRVEEFAFERWSGRWMFAIAGIGLATGGLLGRWSAKRRAQQGATAAESAPERHLDAADAVLRSLLERWPSLEAQGTEAKETIAALSPLIDETLPAFAAARPTIVARMGLGGFAMVMDRFAAAERQIHRAWSAAADGVPQESRTCLVTALKHLAATRERVMATRSR